jgi:hypothetical protein
MNTNNRWLDVFSIVVVIFAVLASSSSRAEADDFGFLNEQELLSIARSVSPQTHWQKSKWWTDGYFSSSGKQKLKKVASKPITVLMGPPNCPTAYWWYWGGEKFGKKYESKWQADIRKRLVGFPSEVISYCLKSNPPIKGGFITNHPINLRYVSREVATVIIRELATDNVIAVRAIQENDYLSKKTGGRIFNQNLKEICEFKFLESDSAIIRCKFFGVFPAEFAVTDVFKGQYKLFGKNEKYAFFITNLNLADTKNKFSSLLKDKSKKKCSFNCN